MQNLVQFISGVGDNNCQECNWRGVTLITLVSLCVYIHLCDLNNPTLFKNCNEIQQLKN